MQKQFEAKIVLREAEMRDLQGRKNEISASSQYNRLKLTARSDGQAKEFTNMNRQISALDTKIEDCKTDILAWQQIVSSQRSHGQAHSQALAKSFVPLGINEKNAAKIKAKVAEFTARMDSGQGIDTPAVKTPKRIQPSDPYAAAPTGRRILEPEPPAGWVPPAERRRLAAEAAASAPPPVGPNEYMKAAMLEKLAKERKNYRTGDVLTSDNRILRAPVVSATDSTEVSAADLIEDDVFDNVDIAGAEDAGVVDVGELNLVSPGNPEEENDTLLMEKVIQSHYGTLGLDDI